MNALAHDTWSYSADPDAGSVDDAGMHDAIDEFRSHFDKESIELQLLEMESSLTSNRKDKSEIVHGLFRDIHSLKGTSATLKIDPLTHYLHIYEDALGVISNNVLRIRSIKRTDIMDYFLQSLDMMERMLDKFYIQPDYIMKDHREFFGFYIRMIVTARSIVASPGDYLDLEEFNEDVF